MIGLLLASALLSASNEPGGPPVGQTVVIADSCAPGLSDPRTFVAATYARYQSYPNEPPRDRTCAYSRRLARLFAAYEAWQRTHSDEVGALDFDWWTNAQDYQIRNLSYRVIVEGPNLRWVIARFDNYDRHDEIRFRFVREGRRFGREGRRWYLDDAMQGTGSGDHGWTLSALLQNPAG